MHHTINYVEWRAPDLGVIETFYGKVFGWSFQHWGDEYVSFDGAGLNGGFAKGKASAEGPLVVLYSNDLAATEAAIKMAGGAITESAFEFPGGRRFHFKDPAGNQLAVWTKDEATP